MSSRQATGRESVPSPPPSGPGHLTSGLLFFFLRGESTSNPTSPGGSWLQCTGPAPAPEALLKRCRRVNVLRESFFLSLPCVASLHLPPKPKVFPPPYFLLSSCVCRGRLSARLTRPLLSVLNPARSDLRGRTPPFIAPSAAPRLIDPRYWPSEHSSQRYLSLPGLGL